MKLRSIAIPLLAAGAALALAACSSGTPGGSSASPKKTVKIAVVLGGLKNDGGFNQLGADAALAVQKEGLATVQIKESVTTSTAAETAFRQYASQGYQLIIGWGLDFSDPIFKVAKELPGTDFVATGSADILNKATANVETWSYDSEQVGYLEGWLAGKSKLSPVAVVDGELAPFNQLQYKAVTVGLKAANPDATELSPVFTGSWDDANLASQATKAQVAAGAKLIITGAEAYTPGVLSAAKTAGVATLGASKTSSSDAADVNLGRVTIDFTPTLEQIVKRQAAGDYGKHSYLSGIANKGVVLADFNTSKFAPAYSAEVKHEVAELAEKIADGTVKLPTVN